LKPCRERKLPKKTKKRTRADGRRLTRPKALFDGTRYGID